MGPAAEVSFPDQIGILRSLATYKYNDYQQYTPGREFIESLALWLQQFHSTDDRRNALRFIHERLIYISDAEMRHLVNLMSRDRVPAILQRHVARKLSLPTYRITAVRNHQLYHRAARATAFLGMSDGARIDEFRRNSRGFSNEQFALTYELSNSRAQSMITELREDLRDEKAAFAYIFLVDDFAGSGTTILRDDESGSCAGRLARFVKHTLPELRGDTCPRIFLVLYLATTQALEHIRTKIECYPNPPWGSDDSPKVTALMELGYQSRLDHNRQDPEYETDQLFDAILHRYYCSAIEDEHKKNVVHGYADCGLPLIMTHNTPNNSVYLLWEQSHTRPLFPRFERHQSRIPDDV